MVSSTIKQFNKLNIPILKEINKVYDLKSKKINHELISNLRHYNNCAIGSVRKKLGLPVIDEPNSMYNCRECNLLAGEFPDIIYYANNIRYHLIDDIELYYLDKYGYEREFKEYKERYEGLLIELKQHLVKDHNINFNEWV